MANILDFLFKKGDHQDKKDNIDELELARYVLEKDTELETDVAERLYGITNQIGSGYRMAGYQILRDFYEGDQWKYIKEDGGTMRVYNYIFTTVNNYTSFLTNEPVDIDIDAFPQIDDEQQALASVTEDVVQDILDSNLFSHHFEDAVQNGSLIGDSVIIGPFWEPVKKKIWFSNLRKPEFVRILWADTNYYDINGYILHYRISFEKATKQFGKLIKAKGIKLKAETEGEFPSSNQKKGRDTAAGGEAAGAENKVTIRQYWDDKYMLLMIGKQVLDFQVHNWGFIPICYVRNIPHPWRSWGVADSEHMLDPQVEYNESNSEIRDILRQTAFSTIFGKNISGMSNVKAGVYQIVDVGDEAEVFPDPRKNTSNFVESYATRRQQDVFNISGVPEFLFGGPRIKEATGRALSVLMQGVNNRIKSRQARWEPQLIRLINNVLRLLEIYITNGSKIIPEKYKISVFFPSIMIRNVTEEINKFNAKIQSLETTMKNIGVGKPREEKEIIKKELSDTQLMLEIAKQPQLQLQLQQMIQQQIQAERGNPIQPENRNPMLTEDENEGEELPASSRGASTQSPVSPKGAANRNAQRGGGAVPIE